MGYLGGPNFPEDPTDLGPLVPLPGGFAAVFEYLASVGYRGFEFFQFTQGANGSAAAHDRGDPHRTWTTPGSRRSARTPAAWRRWCDPTDRAQAQIDIAHILGHRMIGTAGDPVERRDREPARELADAAANYKHRRRGAGGRGHRYYLHPEQNNFHFFNDPAHPELVRVHRIDWFTENTDPSSCSSSPTSSTPTPAARASRTRSTAATLVDRLGYWCCATSKRILAWHVKDGSRLVPQPRPPANPFTQTVARRLPARRRRTRSTRARARSARATRSTRTPP